MSKVSIFLFVCIASFPLLYSYLLYRIDKNEIKKIISQKNPDMLIIERVKKYMQIPLNEKPKILFVKDKQTLKKYPLYKVIKNGDIILVYPKEKLAFVYNPYSDTTVGIVDVAGSTF